MLWRRLPPFPILKASISTALTQICDASTLTTTTLQSAVDSPVASDSRKSPSILELREKKLQTEVFAALIVRSD
jgi:hypothetical protein